MVKYDCVFAYTRPGATYPAYINVSAVEGDEENIAVCVRDHAQTVDAEDGAHFGSGDTIQKLLPISEAVKMAHAILDKYEPSQTAVRPAVEITINERVGDVERIETKRVYQTHSEFGLAAQIIRLANFIMQNFANEPSKSEGAIDTAIRLLRAYVRLHNDLSYALVRLAPLKAPSDARTVNLIAAGLRAGQAEAPALGEDIAHTPGGEFVSIGTHAVPCEDFEIPAGQDAARVDGTNEPAAQSGPLGGHYIGLDRATPPRPTDGQGSFSDEQEPPPPYDPPEPVIGRDLGDEDDDIPF